MSTALGENAHCSRKAGTTHKAFDFVFSTESRIFCEVGIIGATERSCKDVGGYIDTVARDAMGVSS